jgi:uncharacterized protein (TIGR03905 family)
MFEYKPQGVCSRKITFDLREGRVHDVAFEAGCDGNLKAIGKLVEGMDARELIAVLKNNTCGFRKTSCADQLALAVEKSLAG